MGIVPPPPSHAPIPPNFPPLFAATFTLSATLDLASALCRDKQTLFILQDVRLPKGFFYLCSLFILAFPLCPLPTFRFPLPHYPPFCLPFFHLSVPFFSSLFPSFFPCLLFYCPIGPFVNSSGLSLFCFILSFPFFYP